MKTVECRAAVAPCRLSGFYANIRRLSAITTIPAIKSTDGDMMLSVLPGSGEQFVE